jgi:hypothetical protein
LSVITTILPSEKAVKNAAKPLEHISTAENAGLIDLRRVPVQK